MVVFWSPLDVFFLGAGTCVFGTTDRVRTASAGLVGFRYSPIYRRRYVASPTASMPSFDRYAGRRGWRQAVIWGVTWDRIHRFFSRIMSYPCCGPGRAVCVELRSKIKPVKRRADILMAQ